MRPLRSAWTTLRADAAAPTRWPALDGIRGVALAGVVGYHLWRLLFEGQGAHGGGLAPMWTWPLGMAKFTIDVFFVLSGALVVHSWERLRRNRRGFAALREYARRRARRVLPVWWLCLLVLVPLVAPYLLTPGGWGDLATFVAVQQYVVPGLPAQVNTVSWSLTTEVHFYLLVPLLAPLLRRRARWVLLAAALALAVVWWDGARFGMAASLLPGRLDQFVVGAIVGSIVVAHEDGHRSRLVRLARMRWTGLAGGLVLLAAGIWHGRTTGIMTGHAVDPLLHPVAGLVIGLLVLRVVTRDHDTGRPGSLSAPWARGLGTISYSVYLWHYPIFLYGLAWLGLEGRGLGPDAVLGATALVSISFAAGAVSYLLVERPFFRRHTAGAAAGPDPDQQAGSVPGRVAAGTEPAGPSGGRVAGQVSGGSSQFVDPPPEPAGASRG